MRLSTESGDRGYDAWLDAMATGKSIDVTLDGVPRNDCTVADEEGGYIVYAPRDDFGDIKNDGENILTKYARGKVEIHIE